MPALSDPTPHTARAEMTLADHLATPAPGDALIVVDVQRDFLRRGALPVPGGDEVVRPLNRYLRVFAERQLPIFATRDWHPPDHCSFLAQGGGWPAHCVRGSSGAEFAPQLELPPGVQVVSKGTEAAREAYSGFEHTDLDRRLRELDVGRLFVGGLATEHCVLATVEDAVDLGFSVILLTDAIQALRPSGGRQALEMMTRRGVEFLSRQWLSEPSAVNPA